MDKELFSLAVQGVRRKRRSSGLVVLVLLVSFGFALMSLSVLGSIQATNASYRQNLYGSWYYALPNGQPQDAEFLSRWAGAKRWGQMQCYGTTRGGVSVGTIDEGLRELGRLELASGRMAVRSAGGGHRGGRSGRDGAGSRPRPKDRPGYRHPLRGRDPGHPAQLYPHRRDPSLYGSLDVERKRRLAPGGGGGDPGGSPGGAGENGRPRPVPRLGGGPAGLLLLHPAPA